MRHVYIYEVSLNHCSLRVMVNYTYAINTYPNAYTLHVSTLIITLIQLLYIHKTIGCLDIMLLFVATRGTS